MKLVNIGSLVLMVFLCGSLFSQAQQTARNATVVVPPLVNFSGGLTDANSKPLTGVVGVTFSLYQDEEGGSPLWIETQNVTPDKFGHYTVQLGAASTQGLPADLFSSGEARWLGVQAQGQAEQPRVMLLSVPYAMKAGDATTIGGLPPSAFVMASSPTKNQGKASPGVETQNYIPVFTNGSGGLGNSILFQLGTTEVGIGTTTPSATLEVNGTTKFDGLAGFASGQTFPGTLMGITAGTGINVTGSKTSPTVGINTTFANEFYAQLKAPNTFTANQTVNGTMTATTFSGNGAGLTNVIAANANELGGLAPSAFAQVGAANNFVGNQAIMGNLTDTGNITATGAINGQTANLSGTTNTGGVVNITQSGSAYGLNINAASGAAGVNAVGLDVGLSGTANLASGGTGVLGTTSGGYGVYGQDFATSGASTGVLGTSSSPSGVGVAGQATATGGLSEGIGVYGISSSVAGIGVEGVASASAQTGVSGVAMGVLGVGGSFQGGPYGQGLSAYGGNSTTDANAASGGDLHGGSSPGGFGGDGADFYGGRGITAGYGIAAGAGTGAGSLDNYPVAGVVGTGPYNSANVADGPGVLGNDGLLSQTGANSALLNTDIGVWGDAGTGLYGVAASADNTVALIAVNSSSAAPTVRATNASSSSTSPVFLGATVGGGGYAILGATGCSQTMGLQLGQAGMASNCENYTVQGDGTGNTYVNGSGSAGKVVFRINNVSPSPMILNNNQTVTIASLDVTTSLTKPAGTFKIDHPLDPANKYLYHSFVESPDMMNIYNGVTVLDGSGEAVVTLPDWFQALNRDFRYQLTAIGAPGPNLYIAEEVENNHFKIAGGKPGSKVSWQVTGIRQDAFANAHRVQVEVEKAPQDRGHYLHPELFGAAETARIGYEAPMQLAPAAETTVNPSGTARFAPRARPITHRPLLPVLPKLPAVKAPAKQVAQASK